MFLYLALYRLDWPAFFVSFKKLEYHLLPIIFIWSSLAGLIRAVRWRVLLSAEKKIPVPSVFRGNMAGYLGNNIFPGRAGEFIRAAYISRENKVPASFVLATGLVERFIDLMALVIISFLSLSASNLFSQPLQNALDLLSFAALAGFIVILLLPYGGQNLFPIIEWIPWSNAATKSKLTLLLDQFLRGVKALHHPRRILSFAFYTCLIWPMDAIGITLLGRTLGLELTLFQALLLLAGLGLSSAIPSTPGYVGVYQLVAVIILEPFNVSSTNAVALIIVLQVTNLLTTMIWGGWAAWRVRSASLPKKESNIDA